MQWERKKKQKEEEKKGERRGRTVFIEVIALSPALKDQGRNSFKIVPGSRKTTEKGTGSKVWAEIGSLPEGVAAGHVGSPLPR